MRNIDWLLLENFLLSSISVHLFTSAFDRVLIKLVLSLIVTKIRQSRRSSATYD